MSRVIKNNDGVAVVEGTPAASLVKDVDKFFATKPPERMAGESVGQPRKLDPRSGRRPSFENLSTQEQAEVTARREQMMEDRKARALNTRSPEEEIALRDEMFKTEDPLPRDTVYRDLEDSPMRPKPRRREGESPLRRRNEAKDKAESRRVRFFQRRRSRKEAERSQREQESTQGKFITTLGR